MTKLKERIDTRLTTEDMDAFEVELKRVLRRVALLKAATQGEAKITKVWRKGYTISEHKVRGHYMRLVRLGKPPEAK